MPKTMSPDLLKALQGVCYIAQHIKDADKDKEVSFTKWYLNICLKQKNFNRTTQTCTLLFVYG